MCRYVLLGASNLDGSMAGCHERRMEQTCVGSYSWNKVRGCAGAFFLFLKMEDFGFALPSWQVLRMGDSRMISMRIFAQKMSNTPCSGMLKRFLDMKLECSKKNLVLDQSNPLSGRRGMRHMQDRGSSMERGRKGRTMT